MSNILSIYRVNRRRRAERAPSPDETIGLFLRQLHEEAKNALLCAECELAAFVARDKVLTAHGVLDINYTGNSRKGRIEELERGVTDATADLAHAEACLRWLEGVEEPKAVVRKERMF